MTTPWNCQFERHGEYLVCRRCGYRHRTDKRPEQVASACPKAERPKPSPRVVHPKSRFRVGTAAKRILGWLGIEPGGCKCRSRAEEMDRMGLVGVWRRRREIVGWFAAEAGRRKLRYHAAAGYAVLAAA